MALGLAAFPGRRRCSGCRRARMSGSMCGYCRCRADRCCVTGSACLVLTAADLMTQARPSHSLEWPAEAMSMTTGRQTRHRRKYLHRIGGAHDGRLSTTADLRSSLTSGPCSNSFHQPVRLVLWSAILERHANRHPLHRLGPCCTAARCPGSPQPHLWTSWPQVPPASCFESDLSVPWLEVNSLWQH